MAWRGIGDKPLSEPMLILFIDWYIYIYDTGGDELMSPTEWKLVTFNVDNNSNKSLWQISISANILSTFNKGINSQITQFFL